MNSRERVIRALEFRCTGRLPRQLWTLEWARLYHPEALEAIQRDFPDDIVGAPTVLARVPSLERGNSSMPGEYVDAWGCTFTNVQAGVIGEVKKPLVLEDDWADAARVHIPEEWLSFDEDAVNDFCRSTDRFVMCGACPRPFEQLQFIRGTQNLFMDLADPPSGFRDFLARMHDFYCRQMEKWARTDVDGLSFMDDWGTQRALLISPAMWEEFFMPMYRDYIDIAHRHGKKIFMHSDGHTLEILPRLVDLGLDAFNTQLFCMGVDKLKPFRGKIAFWGEIDRQHILPRGSLEEVSRAVDQVNEALYADGGVIAQCEFGAGARPENVRRVFERWDELHRD